ncbi:hypothetical protein QE152_g35040 [Popillia japonica]|uniref:Tc1-like transposase DDE domain-containing protein n=1 Tax=Popillia japonica TaxID=7064 RepID=A0AAW1ISR0_POPJA
MTFYTSRYTVLGLPPYHPALNPIELVWASLKEYVAKKNVRFRVADVKELCEEFFRDFPVAEWAKRCAHARKCEEEFLKREGNIDAVVDSR